MLIKKILVDGPKKNPNEDLQKYLWRVNNYDTVSEKVKKLCNVSCLTTTDIDARTAIRRQVYFLLNKYYKGCKVITFGSSNNGFGTKESDLDLLFLPSSKYCKSGTEKETDDPPPTVGQVHNGEVSLAELNELSERNQLIFVCRLLRRIDEFQQVNFIDAKCPIVKFLALNGKFSLSCDLSCRNSLVVSNTNLLKFFESIDSRVKPLVITLRFWAKALGIIQQQSLSSYAFTLLVIFFFQNVHPPILPTVNFLMEMSTSSCKVAGWEVSFIKDRSKVPRTENQDTEGKLLQKFFSFYWNFDFVRNGVCIRTGKELPIVEWKNSDTQGFEVSALCIQDPFDLSHNVGKNMKNNILYQFKLALLMAKEILKDDVDCQINAHRFASLFDVKLLKESSERFSDIQDKFSAEFVINLNLEIIASLGDGEYFLNKWYAKASEAVFELLNYGLLMDCEVIDKAGFIFDNSAENKADIRKCQNCLLTMQCHIFDRVWVKRQNAPILSNMSDMEEFSNAVLQTEHNVSKSMIHSNPDLCCSMPILVFQCKCYKTDFLQIPHLYVALSPLMRCEYKEYVQITKFLLSIIPKMVTKMLTCTTD